jgi:hypothetical protein
MKDVKVKVKFKLDRMIKINKLDCVEWKWIKEFENRKICELWWE